MKKAVLIGFCILVLCGSFLLVNLGTAVAGEPGYNLMEAYQTNAVTLDGKWTSDAEWSDAFICPITGPTFSSNGVWAYKMVMGDTYLMSFLLENLDSTNDTTDKWVICIDGANDGGSAPRTDDVKIEITGHTNLTMYAGNGTGWALKANAAVTWKDSLATSKYNAANHYILEVQGDKGALGAWGANPPPHAIYMSMYDASNATRGTVAWPPTSADNPGRWGVIATYDAAVPEGFTVALVTALSTFAVAGAILLKKRVSLTKL
jgi:hypothetical protein